MVADNGPTEETIIDVEPPGGEINWIHVRRRMKLRWLDKLKQEAMIYADKLEDSGYDTRSWLTRRHPLTRMTELWIYSEDNRQAGYG